MQIKLLILILIFFVHYTFSQTHTYIKKYKAPVNCGGIVSTKHSKFGLMVTGYANCDGLSNGCGTFIAKINENADTIRTKIIGTQTLIHPINSKDGKLWLTGIAPGFSGGYSNIALVECDSNFNVLNVHTYNEPNKNLYLSEVKLCTDSSFIFIGTGNKLQSSPPLYNSTIIKTDKKGDTLFCKQYGYDSSNEYLSSVVTNPSNTFYVCGATTTIDTSDFYISKINANGLPIWTQIYGGNNLDGGGGAFLLNNYLYTITYTESFGFQKYDQNLLFSKIDTIGNLIWSKSITTPLGYNIFQDKSMPYKNGKFILNGHTKNSFGSPWEFLAMEVDTNGVVTNNKVYSFSTTSDRGYGYNTMPTSDNGYIFSVAYGQSPNDEYLLFKTDSAFNSCMPYTSINFTTTDVTSLMHQTTITFDVKPLPIVVGTGSFATSTGCIIQTNCDGYIGIDEINKTENQLKIYPNPSNGNFTLQINQSKVAEHADIVMYDVLGKEVYSKQNIVLTAGLNEINITTQQLPPGIYFCKLNAGSIFYGSKICVE